MNGARRGYGSEAMTSAFPIRLSLLSLILNFGQYITLHFLTEVRQTLD